MAFTFDHYLNSDQAGKNMIMREVFKRLEYLEEKERERSGPPEELKRMDKVAKFRRLPDTPKPGA